MLRSRLKNIINKSKEFSNKKLVENPFDKFKESLPIEIDDNYRLEAAWKAYGSPKNYKQALWEGMIQPIDENNYKLPSIGYNEETDEYEYLNKGKDNDIVAKDIRVWDNDVIPLVLELKLGGYVRTFNEEKDCWTYSKNLEINSFKQGGKKKIKIKTHEDTYIELDSLTDDLKNGRTSVGKNSKGQDLYLGGDGIAAPLNHIPGKLENGGIIDSFLKGGKPKSYQEWVKTVPLDRLSDNYDLETAYQYLPIEELEKWRTATPEQLKDESYHLKSVAPYGNGDYIFLKKGREWINPEVNGELLQYHLGKTGLLFSHDLIFDEDLNRYFYKQKKGFNPQAFKQGGQMNVIPEGALHARRNNMELAKEGEVTHKGVPVVDNNGVQQAEVEKEEWTMTKELTDDVEKWYKKYYNEDISLKEKDELAIKCGKRITEELLHNTDDRAGLLEKIIEENEQA